MLDTEPVWFPDGARLITRDSRARVVHARASSYVRELQHRVAARLAGRPHLLLRMHVLRVMRRERPGQCVFQLRRWVRATAHATGQELEGRPSPRQGSREPEGE